MSYTVLARRYRARCFGQVIGQEPIAKTLCNAIRYGRVAHAYLFTGTRGVGKTSMARIFATALNAPDTVEDCPESPDRQETPAEDVQQRMAAAIHGGEDLNVIEIDGASNNSVDQARQLIANAALAPTGHALYKIYIIDEVHMLSTAAFNALLKTMEEPPSHVKFILCTTESHKVPATIQSRCQRFDFGNIATSRIAEHLTSVLKQEAIDAQDEVVWQLARLGCGSMRDALSVMDRLVAAGEQPLSSKLLETMLGLPPQDLVVQLVDAVGQGDVAQSLQCTGQLVDHGIAQDQLIEAMIEWLRQLMLLSACGADSELVELSSEARATAIEQAKCFDTSGLVHMIALCENLQRNSKSSSNPRALLDATVVRLALAEKMADVTAVLSGAAPVAPPSKKKAAEPPPTEVTAPSGPPASPSDVEAGKDLDGVWSRLVRQAQEKASLSWVSKLQLVKVVDRDVHLRVRHGHRDILSFANQQRSRLAELFAEVLGRPVQIHISDGGQESEAGVLRVAAGERQVDEQMALSLPLVRQVLDQFDATLIDVRPSNASRPGSPLTAADGDREAET